MSDIRAKIVHWLRGYEIKHESQVSSPSPHTRAADEIELLETERDEAWAECDRLRADVARLTAETDRLRPVYVAAVEWLDHLEDKGGHYLDGIPGELMDACERAGAWDGPPDDEARSLDRGSVDAARQRISELTRDGDIGMARRWLGVGQ